MAAHRGKDRGPLTDALRAEASGALEPLGLRLLSLSFGEISSD